MEIMSDHIHFLISCNPRFGIMKCVSVLKQQTAYNMQKEPPGFSKLSSLWNRSCFVSTVGSASLETVKHYIKSQKDK